MPKDRSIPDSPLPNQAAWMPPRMGVLLASSDEQTRLHAQQLSEQLHLPLTTTNTEDCDLLLTVTDTGLELRETGPAAAGGVRADFGRSTRDAHRLATASRRQPLALAVGLKKRKPSVLDATAGLGRDALLLACLGCTVTAVERSPILGVMLRDALDRAAESPQLGRIIQNRLTLIVGDAVNMLTQLSDSDVPEVVYLDPMFPPKSKSALPKKEMRILRRLVGDDRDSAPLFDAARRVARNRVVVKRHPHAPPLAPEPTLTFKSKLARYDVYLIRS